MVYAAAGTVWPCSSSERHWAEVRTCSWLCIVAGTAFHMLIPNASISFCTLWHSWSNLVLQKVSWETQTCKFLGLYQSFLTQGVCVCGCHWYFFSSSVWIEELICHFRHTKHLYKAESHGTKPATQLGLAPGDWCDALQQLRQPCMAMLKSQESYPWSKTWKIQDFANVKPKS